MKKALIHLKEDLQSSIGFRYAAAHTRQLGMDLQVMHVVEPVKKPQDNTGWVRRSWEKELLDAGYGEINRLIRTENIAYFEAGEPKIAIGEKDDEILQELNSNTYAVYFEGYLNRENHADFYNFLDGHRFRDTGCPVLIVKDLVTIDNMFLLVNEKTDTDGFIRSLSNLYQQANGRINLTVLSYTYKRTKELLFMDRNRNGAFLDNIGDLLKKNGWNEPDWLIVKGPPEMMAVYMQGYGLVATSFPEKITPRAELLARLNNPVLMFSQ